MGSPTRPSQANGPTYNEFLILKSLLVQEQHGLGLIEDVLSRTKGEVFLSPGTLYAALKRMYKQGWIDDSEHDHPAADGNQERRKYYKLTEKGKATIVAELKRLEDIVNDTYELLDLASPQHEYKSPKLISRQKQPHRIT